MLRCMRYRWSMSSLFLAIWHIFFNWIWDTISWDLLRIFITFCHFISLLAYKTWATKMYKLFKYLPIVFNYTWLVGTIVSEQNNIPFLCYLRMMILNYLYCPLFHTQRGNLIFDIFFFINHLLKIIWLIIDKLIFDLVYTNEFLT